MVEALGTPCWCTTLPALPANSLPDPDDGRCLCPACLKAWMEGLDGTGMTTGETRGAQSL
jgi:hypothetical protein